MARKIKNNGFTLVEVITAIGLLAIIIAFSSVIFRFGIDAYRVSAANAEIMQKARAITGQLNSDLQGLRKDAPVAIWFEQNPSNATERYDQLMFFADGDFTSMQLYSSSGEPLSLDDLSAGGDYISGNLARIHYGQIHDNLGRRCHILTNDPCIVNHNDWLGSDVTSFAVKISEKFSGSTDYKNDRFEHDTMPLNEWKKIDQTDFVRLKEVAFDSRPLFVLADPNTYHNLLCEGISSFAVQWAYWDDNSSLDKELRWFPSEDPDNDGSDSDSQFSGGNSFGVYFNLPEWTTISDWEFIGQTGYNSSNNFADDFFPDALKFTFTVHDSKDVIKGGRTFTHIVYLKD